MARRLARLTLDNLGDLPIGCRSCAFWELDPVRRQRAAEAAGDGAAEKEAWVSRVLLEWGSCGRVAYVDNDPAGYVLYAPPTYLPGADAFPTAPVSEDAVLLATAMVFPEYAGQGLGRVLMQTVVKDLVKRGGIRARRGDRGHPGRRARRAGQRHLRRLRAAGRLPAAGRLQDPPAARRATRGCASSCVGGHLARRGGERPGAAAGRRTPGAAPGRRPDPPGVAPRRPPRRRLSRRTAATGVRAGAGRRPPGAR